MDDLIGTERQNGEKRALVDEAEQLRTALESALEENANLVDERDRLRQHARDLARELSEMNGTLSQARAETLSSMGDMARYGHAEEELRVAFEELQVLTEELEVANANLQEANSDLDARVEERTRQLKRANAALQVTEASLRAVADLVPELLWRTDSAGRADWFNQRWFAVTRQTPDEALGLGWLNVVHPVDLAGTRAAWDAAVATGEPYQHEHRLRDASGTFRWFLVRAEPLRNAEGRIINWFAAGTDIQDNRTAMEALRKSEQRFRTLVEGMPQLVWRAVDGGQWTWSSPQWSDYTGQTSEQALGLGWLDALHSRDRSRAMELWDLAQERRSLDFESRILHAGEGRHRHFRTRAVAVTDESDRIVEWLGTSTDVDDLFQLQQRQHLLVTELQHRTRNLMAVVQAVTARTLRGASSLEGFERCIDDRFSALARVQGLLSRRENGARVTFDALLREEMSAHVELGADGNGQQVTLDGPEGIGLQSATVQTFALALHELATNAVKYGALSRPEGHLRVAWRVRTDERHDRHLEVDWRETGVSDIPESGASPRGGGYGRELIERALPYQLGARTRYVFEPDGVHCTIDVTVPSDEFHLETIDG